MLSGGASGKMIFLNGVIVQVTAASATQFSFNYGPAKALHYVSASDAALKFQVVQVNTNNQLQAIAAAGPVTSVAVASNVLTVVQANTFSVGQFVVLQGLAAGEVPQGAIVQIVSASSTGWTANLQAANLSATTGETGTASLLVTNGGVPITIASSPNAITNTLAAASSASVAGVMTLTSINTLSVGNIVVVQGVGTNTVLNGTIGTVIATSLTNAAFEANGWTVIASTSADTGVASLLVTGSAPSTDSDSEAPSGANLSASYIRVVALGN
jgi:hypothetical protein